MADEPKNVLPLMKETATVTAEKRITGRVRVSTHTEAVETMVPVDLADVHVEVTRVPMDRRVDRAPEVVTEGDLTIVPVVEERLIVTRELYVREEIHIRRVMHRETSDVPVTIRRQTASIERLPPQDAPDSSPFPKEKET
ncbi:YsnF/AvaK domain-containing protein [Falsirhodobacter sp. 1013]|uniref:YsnF/AvaK domain-containing protein n=1 Tax=Falsirhodobacter sp. 1013 TaxID=3417566 RepID=UPI003EB828DA